MKSHKDIFGKFPALFPFSCWGMAQGFLAYLFMVLNSQGVWWGNLIAVLASVVLGGITSVLVFGMLMRAPVLLRCLGFQVVSILIPFELVIGGNSIYYNMLYIGGPLNLLVSLIWAIELLPFSLASAAVYFLASSK